MNEKPKIRNKKFIIGLLSAASAIGMIANSGTAWGRNLEVTNGGAGKLSDGANLQIIGGAAAGVVQKDDTIKLSNGMNLTYDLTVDLGYLDLDNNGAKIIALGNAGGVTVSHTYIKAVAAEVISLTFENQDNNVFKLLGTAGHGINGGDAGVSHLGAIIFDGRNAGQKLYLGGAAGTDLGDFAGTIDVANAVNAVEVIVNGKLGLGAGAIGANNAIKLTLEDNSDTTRTLINAATKANATLGAGAKLTLVAGGANGTYTGAIDGSVAGNGILVFKGTAAGAQDIIIDGDIGSANRIDKIQLTKDTNVAQVKVGNVNVNTIEFGRQNHKLTIDANGGAKTVAANITTTTDNTGLLYFAGNNANNVTFKGNIGDNGVNKRFGTIEVDSAGNNQHTITGDVYASKVFLSDANNNVAKLNITGLVDVTTVEFSNAVAHELQITAQTVNITKANLTNAGSKITFNAVAAGTTITAGDGAANTGLVAAGGDKGIAIFNAANGDINYTGLLGATNAARLAELTTQGAKNVTLTGNIYTKAFNVNANTTIIGGYTFDAGAGSVAILDTKTLTLDATNGAINFTAAKIDGSVAAKQGILSIKTADGNGVNINAEIGNTNSINNILVSGDGIVNFQKIKADSNNGGAAFTINDTATAVISGDTTLAGGLVFANDATLQVNATAAAITFIGAITNNNPGFGTVESITNGKNVTFVNDIGVVGANVKKVEVKKLSAAAGDHKFAKVHTNEFVVSNDNAATITVGELHAKEFKIKANAVGTTITVGKFDVAAVTSDGAYGKVIFNAAGNIGGAIANLQGIEIAANNVTVANGSTITGVPITGNGGTLTLGANAGDTASILSTIGAAGSLVNVKAGSTGTYTLGRDIFGDIDFNNNAATIELNDTENSHTVNGQIISTGGNNGTLKVGSKWIVTGDIGNAGTNINAVKLGNGGELTIGGELKTNVSVDNDGDGILKFTKQDAKITTVIGNNDTVRVNKIVFTNGGGVNGKVYVKEINLDNATDTTLIIGDGMTNSDVKYTTTNNGVGTLQVGNASIANVGTENARFKQLKFTGDSATLTNNVYISENIVIGSGGKDTELSLNLAKGKDGKVPALNTDILGSKGKGIVKISAGGVSQKLGVDGDNANDNRLSQIKIDTTDTFAATQIGANKISFMQDGILAVSDANPIIRKVEVVTDKTGSLKFTSSEAVKFMDTVGEETKMLKQILMDKANTLTFSGNVYVNLIDFGDNDLSLSLAKTKGSYKFTTKNSKGKGAVSIDGGGIVTLSGTSIGADGTPIKKVILSKNSTTLNMDGSSIYTTEGIDSNAANNTLNMENSKIVGGIKSSFAWSNIRLKGDGKTSTIIGGAIAPITIEAKSIGAFGGGVFKKITVNKDSIVNFVKGDNNADVKVEEIVHDGIVNIAGANLVLVNAKNVKGINFKGTESGSIKLNSVDDVIGSKALFTFTTETAGIGGVEITQDDVKYAFTSNFGSKDKPLGYFKFSGKNANIEVNDGINVYAGLTGINTKVTFEGDNDRIGDNAIVGLGDSSVVEVDYMKEMLESIESFQYYPDQQTFDSAGLLADCYSVGEAILKGKNNEVGYAIAKKINLTGSETTTFSGLTFVKELNVADTGKVVFKDVGALLSASGKGDITVEKDFYIGKLGTSAAPMNSLKLNTNKNYILGEEIYSNVIDLGKGNSFLLSNNVTLAGTTTGADVQLGLSTKTLTISKGTLTGELEIYTSYDGDNMGNVVITDGDVSGVTDVSVLVERNEGKMPVNGQSFTVVSGKGIDFSKAVRSAEDAYPDEIGGKLLSYTLDENGKLTAKITISATPGTVPGATIPDAEELKITNEIMKLADNAGDSLNKQDVKKFVNGINDIVQGYNECISVEERNLITKMVESGRVDLLENIIEKSSADPVTEARAVDNAAQDLTSNIFSTLGSRLNAVAPMPIGVSSGEGENVPFGVWGTAFGGASKQKMRKNFSGYKNNLVGFTIGADAQVNDSTVIGGAVTYASTKIKHRDSAIGNKTDAKTYMFSAYGSYDLGNDLSIQGVLGFGNSKVTAKRNVVSLLGTQFSSSTLTGKYDTSMYGVQGLLEYRYAINDSVSIIPKGGISYSRFTKGGYTETATDNSIKGQAGTITDKALNSVVGILGTSVVGTINSGDTQFNPEAHAYLNYDFTAKGSKITAKVSAYNIDVAKTAIKPSKASFNVGGGINTVVNDGMYNIGAKVDVVLRQKFVGYQGALSVRVNLK